VSDGVNKESFVHAPTGVPTATLEYSFSPRWDRRPWLRLVAVVCVMAATVVALRPAKMYRVEMACDAITGTVRETIYWPLGMKTGPRVTKLSPLEQQLLTRKISWTPTWQHMTSRNGNAFGQTVSLECSMAPPIVILQAGLGDYAASCSDGELRAFVNTLQNGSESEQRSVIGTAVEKVLAIYSSGVAQ